jgi:hypothetical protein
MGDKSNGGWQVANFTCPISLLITWTFGLSTSSRRLNVSLMRARSQTVTLYIIAVLVDTERKPTIRVQAITVSFFCQRRGIHLLQGSTLTWVHMDVLSVWFGRSRAPSQNHQGCTPNLPSFFELISGCPSDHKKRVQKRHHSIFSSRLQIVNNVGGPRPRHNIGRNVPHFTIMSHVYANSFSRFCRVEIYRVEVKHAERIVQMGNST